MRLSSFKYLRWVVVVPVAVVTGVNASSVLAATPAPHWTVSAYLDPTNLGPNTNRQDEYEVAAHNVGAAATDGVSNIVLTDSLPPGVTAAHVTGEATFTFGVFQNIPCGIVGGVPTCTWDQATTGPVPFGGSLDMKIEVNVGSITEGFALPDTAEVTGGGTIPASTQIETPVSSADAPFGIVTFAFDATESAGLPDIEAGGHPYALTTNLNTSTFHSHTNETAQNTYYPPQGGIRDLFTDLPLGLIGNPQAVPRCPESDLGETADCPPSSQVGILLPRVEGGDGFSVAGGKTEIPVYDMVPARGFPAELGFSYEHLPVLLYATLRPGDYGLRVVAPGLPRAEELHGAELTVWGTPADPSHNAQRLVRDSCATKSCTYGASADIQPRPFLTNSTDCSDLAQAVKLSADAWENPASIPMNSEGVPDFAAANLAEPQWKHATATQPSLTGCNALTFNPTLALQPDTKASGSPAGLAVDLNVPQHENPVDSATPELKDTTVTLPEGLVVNPSSAGGLAGCTPAQAGVGTTEPATCPEASKIGTVTVETPLLEKPLPGQVYLGTPECDPCSEADAKEGRLVKLYIQVNDPERGVVVKLPGTVALDTATGRLTATFDQNPQLPFSDLKLAFKTGQRAPLTTPRACGTYMTTSVLEPWSHNPAPGETQGTPDANTSNSFTIDEGCARGFAPSFSAGTTNNQAGGFSPFTMTISRNDQDQYLSGVTLTTPPGLLGVLKSVVQCPEPQASRGECGQASEIGETSATAGSGSDPFLVTGGRVYLTGPYNGGPFGLSIVVPAVAGPFNLGNVIVRASIRVDRNTAQITVLSDPLPTIRDGIPLQIRTINVTINRSGFMFNPTNCAPLSVNGVLESTSTTKVGVSSPFEAANCAALPFKPSFKVSTQAKTSKANGASLTVKVGSSTGQANIAKVRVTLPKQLPARLTTLQKACTEAQFNTNPAGCPAASAVGTATAITPLLAHPLTGPAYLVSHGGAAFPDLVFVLQGEGILLYLDGNTNIKKGITTSTFNSVPDAPISSFETVFPEGPTSVLATNIPAKSKNSMCGQSLTMPTTITGQNGAVTTQTTKIAVTGCPKVKKKVKHNHHGKKGKGKK